MIFNLNKFLGAVANTLDIVEIEIFGMATNHSKRISYISVKIAHELRLTNEEIFDLASLAIMHDNGASMKILHDNLKGTTKEKINLLESRKEHCLIGEDNLRSFPFLTNPQNVIMYHHEKFDGSGFFGLSKEDIPLMSQIITLSDTLDLAFDLRSSFNKEEIIAFAREQRSRSFSPEITNVFLKISNQDEFWDGLSDKNIDASLQKIIPTFSHQFDYYQLHTITKTLSKIIDAKSKYTQTHSSGLSRKLERMAEYYKLDTITTLKLLIATDLHDLGKLAISNTILDKPGKLSKEEFAEITKHPKITKLCLQDITGFDEITKWSSNHHERLDGSGYPEGLMAKELDFNSRLIACLDVYQALREERPYRKSMNHKKALEILKSMVDLGQLDSTIVDDIHVVFSDI